MTLQRMEMNHIIARSSHFVLNSVRPPDCYGWRNATLPMTANDLILRDYRVNDELIMTVLRRSRT